MTILARSRLYWETLRHLRAEQFYRRALFRAVRPRPDLRAAPALRPGGAGWIAPARRAASMTGAQEFAFLNQTRALDAVGWDDADVPKLWRYNLHYFDDLNAFGAGERADWHHALIARWIAANPPGQGTGWEPYPTSLRIVNWIKWALAGNALPQEAVHSLAVQARWLTRRLEYHLLGNHLFANAKALVFAGLFFQGDEADGWLDKGMSILARELGEQILPDGGHFELSPMYHALALEDLLDLVNLARAFPSVLAGRWAGAAAKWESRTGPMRDWLAVLCHPDGEIAFFNDAAIGIAPSPAELEVYAARLGLPVSPVPDAPVTVLPESGYVRLARDEVAALLDVARIGPDYLPGHAHADTLSFELSLCGQRVLVNSGASQYGVGPERLRQRGTAAHNTVVVDGADSSEVWSGFRVARRARPFDLEVSQADPIVVACSHDGYRRLKGRPVHRRRWTFDAGELRVEDRITGPCGQAQARFHFHPDIRPEMAGGAGEGRARLAGGGFLRWRVAQGSGRLEPSTWHPQFGLDQPSICLVVALVDGASHVNFNWACQES